MHPKLLKGVDLERNLNDVCVEVVLKWTASLKSRNLNDAITVEPESTGYNSFRGHSFDNNKLSLTMWMEETNTFYLKDFVDKCKNPSLAHDAIHALDSITYKGLEVWTPVVIKDMYAYAEWYGCDTDKAVREERMNNLYEVGEEDENRAEEEERAENEDFLLPSKWDKQMADAGYKPCSRKPKLSQKALAALRKESPTGDDLLAKAIQTLRKLARQGHADSGDEDTFANTQAAFIFLWDRECDLLPHALDQAINDRWNSGESRDCQLHVEIDKSSSGDQVFNTVVAIEKLVEIQVAIGAIVDAMRRIIEWP